MRAEVPPVERADLREAGGVQHLGGFVRRVGIEVELQQLRAIGQAEDAPAEFEDGSNEGGGTGEAVLGPIEARVVARVAHGEGEEGVLGMEEEEAAGWREGGVVVGEVRGRERQRVAPVSASTRWRPWKGSRRRRRTRWPREAERRVASPGTG